VSHVEVGRSAAAAAAASGCVPAVIGMAPSGAVFYGVYDLLKSNHLAQLQQDSLMQQQSWQDHHQQQQDLKQTNSSSSSGHHQQQQLELPVLYTLVYGALAGAAAETFLYPLEVIRRKMQLQSMAAGTAQFAGSSTANLLRQHGFKAVTGAAMSPAGAASGATGASGVALARIAAACSAIIRTDGFAGFYAGLLPNMLQVLPSAALSYGTYEAMKQLLSVTTL
jgi:hypothetical protein